MTAEELAAHLDTWAQTRWAYCMDERGKAMQNQRTGPVANQVANKAAEVAYQLMLDEYFALSQYIKAIIPR